MKISTIHTEGKGFIIEKWKTYPDTELLWSQKHIAELNSEIDVEIQPGQYVIIRGDEPEVYGQ